MKRTYLFFILVASTIAPSIMAGQRSEDVNKGGSLMPFKDFVAHCRDSKLPERVSEYRAKMDILIKQWSSSSRPWFGLKPDILKNLQRKKCIPTLHGRYKFRVLNDVARQ
jgi:hypothetical protein